MYTVMLLDIHTHNIPATELQAIVSCSMPGIEQANDTAQQYRSLSVHPWYLSASNMYSQLEWVEANATDAMVLAIGEAGLDKCCDTPMEIQMEAFRKAVAISEKYRKPLIIHSVKTSNEIIGIKKELKPVQPWIMHGFRGKPELMNMCLKHGIYISMGEKYNTITMREVPMDKLMVETDESTTSIHTLYHRAASIKNMSEKDFVEAICSNVQQVFFNH